VKINGKKNKSEVRTAPDKKNNFQNYSLSPNEHQRAPTSTNKHQRAPRSTNESNPRNCNQPRPHLNVQELLERAFGHPLEHEAGQVLAPARAHEVHDVLQQKKNTRLNDTKSSATSQLSQPSTRKDVRYNWRATLQEEKAGGRACALVSKLKGPRGCESDRVPERCREQNFGAERFDVVLSHIEHGFNRHRLPEALPAKHLETHSQPSANRKKK
jgi:hypothetical protein